MSRQRPVIRKPFMIIGGNAKDSQDGEIIYQDCFYGRLEPKDGRLLLSKPSDTLPEHMDMDYLSRYGTAVYAEDEPVYRLFVADCVAMYRISEHPWIYGAKESWHYWFYRSAHDLTYKERYTNDEIWQRLHEFYKNNYK